MRYIILFSYFKCSKTRSQENIFHRNTALIIKDEYGHSLAKIKTPPPTGIKFRILIEAYKLILIYNLFAPNSNFKKRKETIMFSQYDDKNRCPVSHKWDEITLYIECTREENFKRNDALRCHFKKLSLPAVVVNNDNWAETISQNFKLTHNKTIDTIWYCGLK